MSEQREHIKAHAISMSKNANKFYQLKIDIIPI